MPTPNPSPLATPPEFNVYLALAKKKQQEDAAAAVPGGAAQDPAFNPNMPSTYQSAKPADSAVINPLSTAGSPESIFDGGAKTTAQRAGTVPVVKTAENAPPTDANSNNSGAANSSANGAVPVVSNGSSPYVIAPVTSNSTVTKAEDSHTSGGKSSQVDSISPEAFSRAQDQAMSTPGIRAMMGDQANLRAAADPYFAGAKSAGAQLDLSPLMAFSDSQYGSNLLKGYTPPQARLQALAGISKTLGEGNKALSDADYSMLQGSLKNMIEGSQSDTSGTPTTTTNTQEGKPLDLVPMIKYGHELNTQTMGALEKESKIQEGVVPINNALGKLSTILSRYPGSAPGYGSGLLANIKNPLPPALQSTDQKDYDQQMQQLQMAVAEENWKGKQTPPEIASLRVLMGRMQGQSPAMQRAYLDQMQANLRQGMAQRQGSMLPAEQDALNANPAFLKPGQLTHDFGIAKPKVAARPPAGGAPSTAQPTATPAAPAPPGATTAAIKIRSPSGEVQFVNPAAAQKYLSRPGFSIAP